VLWSENLQKLSLLPISLPEFTRLPMKVSDYGARMHAAKRLGFDANKVCSFATHEIG
jgi:hypothetical protein